RKDKVTPECPDTGDGTIPTATITNEVKVEDVAHGRAKVNILGKGKAYYPTFDLESLTRNTWATDDYDDSDLVDVLDRTMAASGRLNTSGDGSDDHEDGMLFGTIRGAIVGIQYYKGEVNNNEMVAMVREPENNYDPNAIKVVNIWGQQVGHIKREMASALAPIVDGKLARIEGVVPFGKNNQFRIPVDISVWGQGDNKPRVVDMLEYRGVRFDPPRTRSEPWRGGMSQSGPTKVYKPRASAAAPMELTKAEMHNELDQLFDDLKQVEKTVMMEPAEAIASTLYPHQKQALNWMCARENSDDLPPFWKSQGRSFLNTVTNFINPTRPPTVRGGILADEMGLGKTLEMIALILTNFQGGQPLAVPNPESTQDVECLDSDSDSDACDGNATTVTEKEVLESALVVQNTQSKLETELEKSVEPVVIDDPVVVVETGQIPQLRKDDTIILESVPDNEVVIVLDDEEEKEKVEEPAPEPEVQIVTGSARPKRASKKPVRYVFSGSDAELESDEEVPKKKSKTKSKKDEVRTPRASQEGDEEEGSQKVVLKSKAAAKPKEPKKTQQKKKGGAKAKGKVLPDMQLPSLPKLPTLPGLGQHVPAVASTCTVTTCDGPLAALQPQPLTGTSSHGSRFAPKGPRPTLILCPLSVISNWLNQFEEHVRPDVDLNVYTHYGADRAKSHTKLVSEDVVITTYNTLAHEYKTKKGNSPLHKVEWLRIVLDEGHIIRNPSALQTKAVLDLKAQRKWILTGTPIQNSIKDLWALISFLGLEPFKSNKMWWQRTIVRPINQGDKAAVARISQLMEQLALRRTKTQKVKGQLLVDLPAKTVFIQKVELSAEERAVYDSMAKEGKLAIGKYFKTGTLLTNYGNVLAILLRLRQLCCHPALIAAAVALKEAENSEGGEGQDELKKKLVETLLAVLSQGADEECCICLDSLCGPVITPCAHVFCMRCINEVITAGVGGKCPLCRGNISKETLVEVPREVQQDKKQAVDADWHSSAKVDAMMECLIKERKKDPSTKSIVVSQFTSLLDLVEKPLRDSGFNFVRLDGTMNAKRRTESMEGFCNPKPGSPTVILLSLKAGGVGINLTAASRLYLLDPAWNPASEDQCFDRCHRLGQTKDVIITKFVVKDSVEERMLELQDKKRKLMARAFSKKLTTEERQQARINDIKTLMDLSGMVPGTSAK
ncbi:helicase-like transcription factor, partial [Patiria miniata]|uniref:Helicase-like transcription factor n=1 Tax=Patiria miniata TaxID=46514 RepID=A0A913YZW6_PATMI